MSPFSMDRLPVEIIFDILTLLPVTTLLRLRCVSRLWCTIIDGQDFAGAQLTRASEEPKALLLSGPTSTAGAEFKFRQDGEYLMACLNCKVHAFQGSCNGLLCFTRRCHDGVRVILVNPIRKQILHLPAEGGFQASAGRTKYGLGFDPKTNTYKVVSVQRSRNNVTRARVCSLGLSMSWREIDSKPACPLLGRPISANGAVHWLDDAQSETKIVAFDVGKEEFSLTGCPEFEVCHLVDLRGVLGIVDCSFDTRIEIWVLDNKAWVREHRIQINAPEELADNSNTEVVGFWGRGEILLRYLKSYLSYIPELDYLKYRHIPCHHADTEVYSHISSLVSLSKFMSTI